MSSDDQSLDRFGLDDRTAETLLSRGDLDVPNEWRDVVRLFEQLGDRVVATSPDEVLLDRMVAAVATDSSAPRSRGRRVRATVGVLAASIGVLLGVTGLAAANALPGGMQRFVSDTLDHVGISVPSPRTHTTPAAPHPTSGTTKTDPHAGVDPSTSTTPSTSVGTGADHASPSVTTRPVQPAPGGATGTGPGGPSGTTPAQTAPKGGPNGTTPGQTAPKGGPSGSGGTTRASGNGNAGANGHAGANGNAGVDGNAGLDGNAGANGNDPPRATARVDNAKGRTRSKAQ